MAGLWKHSVGTAFIARAVSKKLQTEVDASFLGGMLHDLGKIVLDRFFADYYGAVVDTVKSESMSLYQAEMEILGVSHAEVGGLLAESWAFSKNFQNCMTHHHLPRGTRRHQRLVCVIHLADVLCHQLEFGSGWGRAGSRRGRERIGPLLDWRPWADDLEGGGRGRSRRRRIFP